MSLRKGAAESSPNAALMAHGGTKPTIRGERKKPRYSLPMTAAAGGLIAAEICEATRNAKTTAGRHISRRN